MGHTIPSIYSSDNTSSPKYWYVLSNSYSVTFSFQIVDVKKRFESTAVAHQLPPCQELKAKVVECYKKNQHETLNCSADVRAFTDCVNLHRIQILKEKASVEKPAEGK